ncbi:hypothetical protein [Bradyrhizobium iriomotense]|uniref:Transcriptional coactivator p15 (PC4) C-terminal domain-containing protein n=1 Tax=Bradyrhizobium iriomotense TaxID=441950 RepID=A0ABQ6BCD3_9BRAD|nr:hypothetical protein [Bradyrhizobium iriomotense]GLR91365.1 hypothetical protein GCM10007857_80820 [Bradyrhizobium iriomotense]
MASDMQNPALAGAGVRGNSDQAGRQVEREYNQPSARPQRLIASVTKSGREEFRVTLRDYNGTMKAEIRIFERRQDGNWISTPRHIVVGRGSLTEMIDALVEAEARL